MRRRFADYPILVITAATLWAACDSPRSPLAPTPQLPTQATPVPAPPSGNGHLQGMVMDTAFRPLSGVRVEVVTGPHTGRSTVSGPEGRFAFNEPFDERTEVRAIKDGYVTRAAILPPRCATCPYFFLTFYLATPAPSLNISGNYTLTFIADAACTRLPAEARTRTYDITVGPRSLPNVPENTTFTARVTSPQLVEHYDQFPIGVVENFLTFELRGHGPYILERVGDNSYLGFDGLANAIADAEPLPTATTRFDGWIGFCERRTASNGTQYYDCGRTRPECLSTNHQLILRKR